MKRRIFWACIVAMVVGFVGCSSKDDTAVPDTNSNISVFIAVPGQQFDVSIDTSFIGTNLGAGENTGYKSFRAQRYTVSVYPAGNRTNPVASGQISLRNDFHYSVFLSRDHTNAYRLKGIEDKLKPLPEPFTGKIRIVNLSDTYNGAATPVNLDFNITDLGDTTRFQNLNYEAVTAFTSIRAGDWDRDILSAGTTQSLLGKNTSSFTVVDGKFSTWIVYGNALVADSFKLAEFQHN